MIILDPEEKILRVLRDAKWGLTVSDIAKKVKMSRLTTTKYLEALKAKDLVIEKKIGAYRLWFVKESIPDKSLISKKLACALAKAFIIVFDKDVENIARRIGIALVDQLEEEDIFIDARGLEAFAENTYELIASILEMLSEGIKAEGIELSGGRGILRITGELCTDEEVVRVLGILLMGAVEGILKNVLGIENPNLRLQVNKKSIGYELILEVY